MPSSLHNLLGTCFRPIVFSSSVLMALALSVTACQPEESPLKSENETLHKQADKQESVIVSLQEGNKVMQQQIDLLLRLARRHR